MTAQHPFIFSKGVWLGEGTIQFSASDDQLRFFTRWSFESKLEQEILGVQRVEISEVGQTMRNHFRFHEFDSGEFTVELKNEVVGLAKGKGVLDERRLAWEFRCPDIGFEGFEVYELIEADAYRHHAEYASKDLLRTIINGKVWKQAE